MTSSVTALGDTNLSDTTGTHSPVGPKNVTHFGTNRKPICDFLLVINSNLPLILRRFQVMADYWLRQYIVVTSDLN